MAEEGKKVVVIQDASRDVNLTAIRLALEGFSLKAGDTLILLGILHQVNNPMGIKVRIDPSLMFGVNPKYIAEEVDRKTEEYINNAEIMNISKLCERGQIEFRVEVHAGSTPKVVSVKAARNFRATCVILDSHMKKDVKYFMEKLPCGISRMKRDNTIEQLRAPNPRRRRKLLSQKGENQETADATNNDKEKVIYDETIPNVVASSEPASSSSASSVNECRHVDRSREIPRQDYRKGNPYSKSSPRDQPIMTAVSTSSWDYDDDLSPNIRQAKDYYMNFLKENTTDAEKDSTREPSPASVVESQPEEKEAYNTVSPNEQQKQPNEADDWMGGPDEDEEWENSVCSVCQNRRPKIGWTSEFTYAELHAATEGFHPCNFLSEGDFGAVYKGNLNGLKIAVKQHKDAGVRGEKEFKSEVEVLSKARHENLIMLLGSCSEGSNRLLVYEYVCNGSLDQHLSKHARRPLSWEKRMKIAMGIAKGLQYLHENNIIHRDMRPSNILITHDYEALLGDFGLARTQHEGSDLETKVIGTLGYVAPEYAECGKISSKTDVYSFGVVLLQLITGVKTTDKKTLGGKSLVGWARPLLKERKYPDLIDPRITESHDVHQLFWLVRVAEKCLSKDPHKRLTMDKVVFALDHIMKSSKLGRVADISPAKSDSASSSKISYESPDDDITFTIDTTSSNADTKSTRSISHLSVRHPPTPPIRRRPPSPTRLITNSTSRLSRISGSGGDDEKSIAM